MRRRPKEFINPTDLTNCTNFFLYLLVIISIIALISDGLELQMLIDIENKAYPVGDPKTLSPKKFNDLRQLIILINGLVIFIISAILFLTWVYRANYNARRLGAVNMKFTPGWSIAWHFIIFANLFCPFYAMVEIWKASMKPKEWENQVSSPLLVWWWFFWITYNIAGTIIVYLKTIVEKIHSLIILEYFILIVDAMQIVLILIVLAMIKGIYEMQMHHYKLLEQSKKIPKKPIRKRTQSEQDLFL